MPYTHPNHKQVMNNLMDDFHRDGVILMLLFQGYTSKQSSDLSLFFYLKCSGVPVLPFIQGWLYSSALCKEFYIHYSHHIDERTWNAFFLTYFSKTGGNKFSVNWFPFCKGFHTKDSFAKCSVDEWMDGWLDKFAAVEFSDKEMIAFWVCNGTLLFVSRRTL